MGSEKDIGRLVFQSELGDYYMYAQVLIFAVAVLLAGAIWFLVSGLLAAVIAAFMVVFSILVSYSAHAMKYEFCREHLDISVPFRADVQIRYDEIIKAVVSRIRYPESLYCYSSDAVKIHCRKGRTVSVSPKERGDFVKILRERCSQVGSDDQI